MKKVLLTAALFLMCQVILPQEYEESQEKTEIRKQPKSEIKVNLLMSFQRFPEISYELYLKNNITAGLSIGVPIEGSLSIAIQTATKYNFLLTPYCRLYLGNNPQKAFFIEGNAPLMGAKVIDYYSIDNSDDDFYWVVRNNTIFGLGFAAGYKFVNHHGFLGELFLGYGTSVDKSQRGDYLRIGISIGKQF